VQRSRCCGRTTCSARHHQDRQHRAQQARSLRTAAAACGPSGATKALELPHRVLHLAGNTRFAMGSPTAALPNRCCPSTVQSKPFSCMRQHTASDLTAP
jgi:hypothetical protein